MIYKLCIFCPDNDLIINKLIEAATLAGAGIQGEYTHCASIYRGEGNFYASDKTHPATGHSGQMNRVKDAKIEMHCPSEKATLVKEAILKVHPYEEVVLDFIKLEEI